MNQELKNLSNSQLTTRLRTITLEERKITLQILHLINEAGERRIYAERGFLSPFEWLVKDLGYSKSAAMRRLNSAKRLREDPAIAAKIESGKLNITNLAKAQTLIRAEEKRTGEKLAAAEKSAIVNMVEAKSSREAEVALAQHFPEAMKISSKVETIRAAGDEGFQVQVLLTQNQMAKLERVRELTSHSYCGASIAELIEVIADEYLKRKDPLQREVKPRKQVPSNLQNLEQCASGAGSKKEELLQQANESQDRHQFLSETNPIPTSTFASTSTSIPDPIPTSVSRRRKPLKPSVRNFVVRRAHGMCEYFDAESGRRCESRYHPEVDHVTPVAQGGSDDPENLRLLCRAHNALMVERVLGIKISDMILSSRASERVQPIGVLLG